jgi:hypothetical protein
VQSATTVPYAISSIFQLMSKATSLILSNFNGSTSSIFARTIHGQTVSARIILYRFFTMQLAIRNLFRRLTLFHDDSQAVVAKAI